jgi:putative DNA primase/helicase
MNYTYIDRPPDKAALLQAELIFKSLTAIDPGSPLLFKFEDDAQELFATWLEDLELRLRSDELQPTIKSHLSKYRSLFPSLALLFQLADLASKPTKLTKPAIAGRSVSSVSFLPRPHTVNLENTTRALYSCVYFESHARRVCALCETAELHSAYKLAFRIQHGPLAGSFYARDVQRHGWSGLKTARDVERACQELERAGWIKKEATKPGKEGGRPSIQFWINPRVYDLPTDD